MNNIQETYFVMIPLKYRRSIEKLNNEEAGRLFKILMTYGETREEPDTEDMTLSILFDLIKSDFDVISNNYKAKCEKQAQKKKEWWEKQKTKEEADVVALRPISITPEPRREEVEEKVVSKSIPEEIYDLYNEQYVPDLAPCVPQVKSQCVMRIASLMSEGWDKEAFTRLFDKAKASPFLRGDISDWQCNLLWLLNDKNYPKVLAGNYDKTAKAKKEKVEIKVQEPTFVDFEGWEIVGDHMEYAVYKGGVRTVKEVN